MPSSDDATRKLRSGSRDPLLRVEGLSARFAPERALDGVDLRVRRGETLAVVGEAGAGKTTLARAIVRSVPLSAGRVVFDGKDLGGLAKQELASALAHVQLVSGATLRGPDELAALCALEPTLIIFDEAFEAFDAGGRSSLFEQLRRLQDAQAFACLVLTRRLELAAALADEVRVLCAGRIVETGAATSLLTHPYHPYTQRLLLADGGTPAALPGGAADSEGCVFRARCPQAFARCAQEIPAFFAVPGGLSRCFLHEPRPDGDER